MRSVPEQHEKQHFRCHDMDSAAPHECERSGLIRFPAGSHAVFRHVDLITAGCGVDGGLKHADVRLHPDEHQGPFGHLRQLFTVILRSEAGEGSLGKKRRVRRQDFLEFRQSRAESLRILFRCNDGNSECLCPLQQNFDPGQDLFAPSIAPQRRSCRSISEIIVDLLSGIMSLSFCDEKRQKRRKGHETGHSCPNHL